MTSVSPPRRASLRRNFAWNLLGETSYSLGQWLLLVLLARLQSPETVGQFAFALAVTAPVYLLVGLNLRVVQATDARAVWRLADYLRLRHLLNVVALIVSVCLGFLAGPEMAGVVAVVAAAKAAEALSQTYYGYFQRCERLDLVARSLLLRVGGSLLLFSTALLTTSGLLPAALALWLSWLLVAVLHDRSSAERLQACRDGQDAQHEVPSHTKSRSLLPLVRLALPLGVSAGVSSLAVNLPRFLLIGVAGAASLGAYATLAYLAQVITMLTGAMGNAVVPRMATYHRDRKAAELVRLATILSALGVVLALGMLAVVEIWGELLIGAVLGPDYVNQPLLLALVLGAGLSTLQRSMGRGLQAAHRFTAFLAVDILTLVIVGVSGPWLVRAHGPVGAAWSLNAALCAAVLVTAALLWQTVHRLSGRRDTAADSASLGSKARERQRL